MQPMCARTKRSRRLRRPERLGTEDAQDKRTPPAPPQTLAALGRTDAATPVRLGSFWPAACRAPLSFLC